MVLREGEEGTEPVTSAPVSRTQPEGAVAAPTPATAPAPNDAVVPEASLPSEPVPASDEPPGPASENPQTPTPVPPPSKAKPSLAKRIGEIPLLVGLAFLIAVIIKTFLVQAFYIPSGSMIPTLRVGDRVLVEKVGYLFGEPGRGDVVVFEKSVFGVKNTPDLPWHADVRVFFKEMLGLPTGIEEDYIKRVVAVGGDTIGYRGSPRRLYINGETVDQGYVFKGRDPGSPTITGDDCQRLKMDRAGNACRVPAGKIFVMGDNRSNSEDSRVLGPVDEDKIVGRAFVIIWPPSDFGGL